MSERRAVGEAAPQVGARDASGVPEPAAVAELFMGFLERTHVSAPAELAAVVAEQVQTADGADAVIYVVDHEQRHLVPVPAHRPAGLPMLNWSGHAKSSEVISQAATTAFAAAHDAVEVAIEGSLPGRCFVGSEILQSATEEPGRRRLWLPLLDGTERVGVLTLTAGAPHDEPVPEAALAVWERFAHLVAQMVISKGAYGDTFELVRRSRPMALAAELQWALAPPLTFASRGLVVSAMLEPCYEDGGDAFDYAVNSDVAHLAIIDAMGHGLAASGAAAFTLAAYRRARRASFDLPTTYEAIDVALAEQFNAERHATAVLAELDLATGLLSWINAGHPEPLLLRGGRLVKTLSTPPATPLGLPFTGAGITLGTEHLEPGDRVLLYTDGLPEARQPDGSFLGVDRLTDFIERAEHDGYAVPETLRRLRNAVLQHQHGALQDDATAVVLEWRGGTEKRLLPQTATLNEPPVPAERQPVDDGGATTGGR